MIRTGYLRWEIDAQDERTKEDAYARQVILTARPTFRHLTIKHKIAGDLADRFARGEISYAEYQESLEEGEHLTEAERARKPPPDTKLTIENVGPHLFRYSEADRVKMIRYWMDKLHREINTFAHEVVRSAAKHPTLVARTPALRAGYAHLVAHETMRVIEGRSQPAETQETEPMLIDLSVQAEGIPELVAAELVRDVVTKEEFNEFCVYDRISVAHGEQIYRIPRKSHGLIEVWNPKSRQQMCRLCVVFEDPGMPPSDEVVMKYLLAKHQPEMIWKIGVRFPPTSAQFDAPPPKRWRN
ncbi:MAG: hypothetical protein NT172_17110 [Planctomycetota bacterium]|nr:hypothetical protein [Planctomycetota bacterium]